MRKWLAGLCAVVMFFSSCGSFSLADEEAETPVIEESTSAEETVEVIGEEEASAEPVDEEVSEPSGEEPQQEEEDQEDNAEQQSEPTQAEEEETDKREEEEEQEPGEPEPAPEQKETKKTDNQNEKRQEEVTEQEQSPAEESAIQAADGKTVHPTEEVSPAADQNATKETVTLETQGEGKTKTESESTEPEIRSEDEGETEERQEDEEIEQGQTFVAGYVKIKKGVRIYGNANLTGQSLQLALPAIVYAREEAANGLVWEILYALDREMEKGYISAKGDFLSEEDKEAYLNALKGRAGSDEVVSAHSIWLEVITVREETEQEDTDSEYEENDPEQNDENLYEVEEDLYEDEEDLYEVEEIILPDDEDLEDQNGMDRRTAEPEKTEANEEQIDASNEDAQTAAPMMLGTRRLLNTAEKQRLGTPVIHLNQEQFSVGESVIVSVDSVPGAAWYRLELLDQYEDKLFSSTLDEADGLTVTLKENLFDPGTYTVKAVAYSTDESYADSEESVKKFSVTGSRPGAPTVTVAGDPYIGEYLTFTMEGIENPEKLGYRTKTGDQSAWSANEQTYDVTQYRTGGPSSPKEITYSFRVYAEGAWSSWSTDIVVNWTAEGKLDPPGISSPDSLASSEDLVVTLTGLQEGSGGYLTLYSESGQRIASKYFLSISPTVTFEAMSLQLQEGKYRLAAYTEKKRWITSETVSKEIEVYTAPEAPQVELVQTGDLYQGDTLTFRVTASGADAIKWGYKYSETSTAISGSEKQVTANESGTTEISTTAPAGKTDPYVYVFSCRKNGVWSAASSIQVTVASRGNLGESRLIIPENLTPGQDTAFGYVPVDNATSYRILLYRVRQKADGGTVNEYIYEETQYIDRTSGSGAYQNPFTVSGVALNVGEYRWEITAMASGYPSRFVRDTFSISGDQRKGPALTAEPNPLQKLQNATITANAPGAKKVIVYQKWWNGDFQQYSEELEPDEDGKVQTTFRAITGYLSGANPEVFSAKALYDDTWTDFGPELTLALTEADQLIAPEISFSTDEYYAGEDLTISWTESEHAEKYSLRITDEENRNRTRPVRPFQTSEREYVIRGLIPEGRYTVEVTAEAEGMKSSSATATLTVLHRRQSSPFHVSTTETWDGNLMIDEYLDATFPSELVIPDSIDGKQVGGFWFTNDILPSTLTITVPRGVEPVYYSSSLNGVCKTLIIKGYYGSKAEAFVKRFENHSDVTFVSLDPVPVVTIAEGSYTCEKEELRAWFKPVTGASGNYTAAVSGTPVGEDLSLEPVWNEEEQRWDITIPADAMVNSGTLTIRVTAAFEGGGTTAGELETEIDPEFSVEETGDSSLRVVGYNGSKTDIAIPETIGGKAVKSIGTTEQWWRLNRITLPRSLSGNQDGLGAFLLSLASSGEKTVIAAYKGSAAQARILDAWSLLPVAPEFLGEYPTSFPLTEDEILLGREPFWMEKAEEYASIQAYAQLEGSDDIVPMDRLMILENENKTCTVWIAVSEKTTGACSVFSPMQVTIKKPLPPVIQAIPDVTILQSENTVSWENPGKADQFHLRVEMPDQSVLFNSNVNSTSQVISGLDQPGQYAVTLIQDQGEPWEQTVHSQFSVRDVNIQISADKSTIQVGDTLAITITSNANIGNLTIYRDGDLSIGSCSVSAGKPCTVYAGSFVTAGQFTIQAVVGNRPSVKSNELSITVGSKGKLDTPGLSADDVQEIDIEEPGHGLKMKIRTVDHAEIYTVSVYAVLDPQDLVVRSFTAPAQQAAAEQGSDESSGEMEVTIPWNKAGRYRISVMANADGYETSESSPEQEVNVLTYALHLSVISSGGTISLKAPVSWESGFCMTMTSLGSGIVGDDTTGLTADSPWEITVDTVETFANKEDPVDLPEGKERKSYLLLSDSDHPNEPEVVLDEKDFAGKSCTFTATFSRMGNYVMRSVATVDDVIVTWSRPWYIRVIGPKLTPDPTEVWTGETVSFQVDYHKPDGIVELYADGVETPIATGKLVNGTVTLEYRFKKSGNPRTVYARVNNDYSVKHDIVVKAKGKLAVPKATYENIQLIHDGFFMLLDPVDHAEGFTVYFRDENGNFLVRDYPVSTTEKDQAGRLICRIPAAIFEQKGEKAYEFRVMDYGDGYDQNGTDWMTVSMVSEYPAPEILTPGKDATVTEQNTEVTWKSAGENAVYLISLDRKNGDGFESVWKDRNVGKDTSYTLEGLELGATYQVSVGSVTTINAETKVINWNSRVFQVDLPQIHISVSPEYPEGDEKRPVSVKITVEPGKNVQLLAGRADQPQSLSLLKADRVTDEAAEYTFTATEMIDGTYSYTAYAQGTGLLSSLHEEKTFEMVFRDTNKPVVRSVSSKPALIWPNTAVKLIIQANEFSERLEVHRKTGETELLLAVLRASEDADDLISNAGYEYVWEAGAFPSAGQYEFFFVPLNEEGQWGDRFPATVTVAERGSLPTADITNLSNGDILLEDRYTVRWNELSQEEMPGGVQLEGYYVQLYDWNPASGWWRVINSQMVYTGAFELPELAPGQAYRLEVYTKEKDQNVESRNCTVREFSYRTIPAFSVTNIENAGDIGSEVTVSWNAPFWPRNPAFVPDQYVVWWYGPGLEYNEAVKANAKAVSVKGTEKSCVLESAYTLVPGEYSFEVYAILNGGQVQKQATPLNGNLFRIDAATIQWQTSVQEDGVIISGECTGKVDSVSYDLYLDDILLDEWHNQSVRVTNGMFEIFIPASALSEEGNYFVRLYGCVDALNGAAVTAPYFVPVSMKDGEISSIIFNNKTELKDSRVGYSYAGKTVMLRVYYSGMVREKLKVNDSVSGMKILEITDCTKNQNNQYYTDVKLIIPFGLNRLSLTIGNSEKAIYIVAPNQISPEIQHQVYGEYPLLNAFGKTISQTHSGAEITILGEMGLYYYIKSNGVDCFIRKSYIDDEIVTYNREIELEIPYSWYISTDDTNTYLIVEGDQSGLSGLYMIVIGWYEEDGSFREKAYKDASHILGMNQKSHRPYYKKLSIESELMLKKGNTYYVGIAWAGELTDGINGEEQQKINHQIQDQWMNNVAYYYTFDYGKTGIISPSKDQLVNIWDDNRLVIRWWTEKQAIGYEISIYSEDSTSPIVERKIDASSYGNQAIGEYVFMLDDPQYEKLYQLMENVANTNLVAVVRVIER